MPLFHNNIPPAQLSVLVTIKQLHNIFHSMSSIFSHQPAINKLGSSAADSFLVDINMELHTADSVLVDINMELHTVDSILVGINMELLTAESILVDINMEEFNLDSVQVIISKESSLMESIQNFFFRIISNIISYPLLFFFFF